MTAMNETDIVFLSAVDLSSHIRTGKITCVEAMTAYLRHTKINNKRLNAFVTIDAQKALYRAHEADQALEKGQIWGAMHGIPITVKDQFATKDIRTTVSLPQYYRYIPDYNAVAVERLLNSGAIIMGKTNLPPMALDYQTRSPISGVTHNPWDIEHTPGGSSGGGAAAVAAGMSGMDIASDFGGSIRLPAGFCGVYGIKATENLIPEHGVFPHWPDGTMNKIRHMFSYGALARSVDDLKLAIRVMADPGRCCHDISDFVDLEPGISREPVKPIAWTDDFGQMPMDPEIKSMTRSAVEKIEKAGIQIEHHNLDEIDFNFARQTYEKMLDLEIGINSKPFDRLRFYLSGKKNREKVGMTNMAFPVTYKKYMRIISQKERLSIGLERVLSSYDAFLSPISPTSAFKHHPTTRFQGVMPSYEPLRINGQKANYWKAMGHFTTLFNLTGSPVVAIPIGTTQKGLPVGIQIAGRKWQDMELLDTANKLNKAINGYHKPPVESALKTKEQRPVNEPTS